MRQQSFVQETNVNYHIASQASRKICVQIR